MDGQANGHHTDPIQLASPIEVFSPPDETLENAKAIPLPASPGERPFAGTGKAFPFKLGRDTPDLDPEGANTSTITLTTEAGVVPPPPKEHESGAAQTGATTIPDDEQLRPVVDDDDDDDDDDAQDETDPHHHHHHQSSPIEPVEDAHSDHQHHHHADADGVDHYDLRNNNKNRLPLEGGENGKELANNNAVGPTEGKRRSTLVDAKGVLYHGPGVVGGLGRKKRKEEDDDDGGVMRPGIDRSDTASLD